MVAYQLQPSKRVRGFIQVLICALCRVFVIRSDIQLCSLLDGDILIAGSVSSANLWSFLQAFAVSLLLSCEDVHAAAEVVKTYSIKSNGKGTALLSFLSLFGMIDHGLMILFRGKNEVQRVSIVDVFFCFFLVILWGKKKIGNRATNLVGTMRKVHANNIETSYEYG